MKKHQIANLFKKSVAALLVFTFSYSQLLWAADVRLMLQRAKASFDEDELRRGGDPILDPTSPAGAEVQHQQDLQDLQAMNFRLTTQNGDILQYVGNKLSEVKRPDGSRLKNIQTDAEGNIVSADLKLSDGSVQIFENGQVIGYQRPDGSQAIYENGVVSKTIAKNGEETLYSYTKDAQGNVIETVLDSARFHAVYGSDGKIRSSIQKSDNAASVYSNGLLTRIDLADGASLRFGAVNSGEEITTKLDFLSDAHGNRFFYGTDGKLERVLSSRGFQLKQLVLTADGSGFLGYSVHAADGSLLSADGLTTHPELAPAKAYSGAFVDAKTGFREAIYRTAERTLKSALTSDGNRLTFDADGILTGAVDPNGRQTAFSFSQSSLSNVLGVEMARGGVTSRYDAGGRLAEVSVGGMTIHYKKDSDAIDFIEREDGTEMYGLAFDAKGALTGAKIVLPDGEIRVYESGKLVSLTKPDDTQLFYFDGKPTKLITSQKLSYNFTYKPEGIEAALDASIVPSADTTIRFDYTQDFSLKKVVRQNQEIMSYFNNDLVRIDAPGKEAQVFDYVKDANGKLLSYTVTQGSLRTFYGADNQPSVAIITPSAENPHAIEVTYAYGKIREVRKDGTLTFRYSYSFDAAGEEITTIKDLEEKATKTYKTGLLLASLSDETSVHSAYEYEGQLVKKVVVTRLGRPLHSYDYSYEADKTLVRDEEGVLRTYGADKKLLFLEKQGMKYTYSYGKGADDKEIVNEALIEKRLEDGSLAKFVDGKMSRIERADGLVISDLVLDGNRQLVKATVTFADGSKKVFNDKTILEEMVPGGPHFFYTDDKISKVIEADGTEYTYSYSVKANDPKLLYDRTAAGRAVTLKGNAYVDPTNRKVGHGSIRFDGDADYASVADDAAWDFGSGNFTIDFWANFEALKTVGFVSQGTSVNDRWSFGWYGGYLSFIEKSGGVVHINEIVAWTPQINTWYHVALTRSGNDLNFFVNGNKVGTANVGASVIQDFSEELRIGAGWDGGVPLYFQGRIEEMRISKGTARWTANFTPSTTADEPDAASSLLVRSGADKEEVEFVDLTRDGVRHRYDAAGNHTGFFIGNDFYSKTSERGFYEDWGPASRKVSLKNGAQVSAAGSRFGAGALVLDGVDDWAALPDDAAWSFGSSDFTIDLWANFEAVGFSGFLGQGTTINDRWSFGWNAGYLNFLEKSGGAIHMNEIAAWTPQANTWYHIALVRAGNSLRFFVNGTMVGNVPVSGVLADFTEELRVGAGWDGGASRFFKGKLEEVRISKGVARWTDSFVVPAGPAASDGSTSLLLRNASVAADVVVYKSGAGWAAYDVQGNYLSSKRADAASTASFTSAGRHSQSKPVLPYKERRSASVDLGDGVTGRYEYGLLTKIEQNGNPLYEYTRWLLNGQRQTFVKRNGVRYNYDESNRLSGYTLDGIYYGETSELKVYGDESAAKYASDARGNAALRRDKSRFGGLGTYVDGDGDYFSVKDSDDWTFGSADFTIDFWANFETLGYGGFISQGTSINDRWHFGWSGGYLNFHEKSGGAVHVNEIAAWTPQANTWNHIAVARSGAVLSFYANGALVGSSNIGTASIANFAEELRIGAGWDGGAPRYFKGALDEVRVTKGAALWTQSFAPPTGPSSARPDTKLLLHETVKPFVGKAYQAENGYIVVDGGRVTDYSLKEVGSETVMFLGQTTVDAGSLPFAESISELVTKNPGRSSWWTTSSGGVMPGEAVVVQEYSSDGTLETQTKADGTVTLFEGNKPSRVLDEKGSVIMEYSYDEAGNLARVFLRNARTVLPQGVLRAKQSIEEQRASTLLELARQKNLAYQSVQSQSAQLRQSLQTQLETLQGQYNEVAGISVQGKKAKSQRGDVLNQIGHAMDDVRVALGALGDQEADAYALLDAQIDTLSDTIEADAERAYADLAVQEAAMKKEILRQEASPVIYDYYRRILGRDPSRNEYEEWLSKTDYDSVTGINTEELLTGEASVGFLDDGSYVKVPANPDWNFGSGDFTIDLWAKFHPNSDGGYQALVSRGGNYPAWRFYWYQGTLRFTSHASDGKSLINFSANWSPSPDTWNHLALVRKGGQLLFYANGLETGALNVGGISLPDIADDLKIGSIRTPGFLGRNRYFKGWIDDFRISKGVARWSGAFIPAKKPHTSDSQTSLLLRTSKTGSSFLVDRSPALYPVVAVGKVTADVTQKKVRETTPDSYALRTRFSTPISLGANNYLSVADSSDWNFAGENFTIDFWTKFTSLSGTQALVSQGGGNTARWGLYWSGGQLKLYVRPSPSATAVTLDAPWDPVTNAWYHVAVVRNQNEFIIFVNGKKMDTDVKTGLVLPDLTEDLRIGTYKSDTDAISYLNGYVDELRISKGTARWLTDFLPSLDPLSPDSQTVLLLRGIDSFGQKSIKDKSFASRMISTVGAPLVDQTQRRTLTKTLVESLKGSLDSATELTERRMYVATIQQKIKDKLATFLSLSQADRVLFAYDLGLAKEELVVLTAADAQKILTWLDSRSLHFGQSAFLSLEAVVEAKLGRVLTQAERLDIAEKGLLIDVLTGIITPLDDGDVVLSMYALNKVAVTFPPKTVLLAT